MEFGVLLKERRLAMGLSQDQLAAATGLDKPRISKAECGRPGVYFGDDAIKALAGALAIDADVLALKAGKIAPHWRDLVADNAEAVLVFFKALEKRDSIPQLVRALEAIAREQRLAGAKAEYNPSEVPL